MVDRTSTRFGKIAKDSEKLREVQVDPGSKT
jgi:hypothetical protein